MRKNILLFASIFIGILISVSFYSILNSDSDSLVQTPLNEATKKFTSEYNWDTAKISQSDLIQGCIGGKDCIPSIDNPTFISATNASEWLNPEDTIFGVTYEGVVRAYPKKILNWHEIVNDTYNDVPVAITYCPLCGTALGFKRELNETVYEFGVSGYLVNNDLVMYDRQTNSLWQQVTGQGIVGDAAENDLVLNKIPVTTTSWERWLNKYPNTQVLSLDTGYSRDYNYYPYGDYEESERLLFDSPVDNKDLPRKEEVYGLTINDVPIAFKVSDISGDFTKTVNFNDTQILIQSFDSGEVKFSNSQTGEEYIPLRGFWFAWTSFHPNTVLWEL